MHGDYNGVPMYQAPLCIGMSLSQGALTNLYDDEPSIQPVSELTTKETVNLYNVFLLNLLCLSFHTSDVPLQFVCQIRIKLFLRFCHTN